MVLKNPLRISSRSFVQHFLLLKTWILCYINLSIVTDHDNHFSVSQYFANFLQNQKPCGTDGDIKSDLDVQSFNKVLERFKLWPSVHHLDVNAAITVCNEEGKKRNVTAIHPNVMDFCQKPSTDLISVIGDNLISVIRFLLPWDCECFYTFSFKSKLIWNVPARTKASHLHTNAGIIRKSESKCRRLRCLSLTQGLD